MLPSEPYLVSPRSVLSKTRLALHASLICINAWRLALVVLVSVFATHPALTES